MKGTKKYLTEILKKNEDLEPGIYHVTIYHDEWCDLLHKKGPCNCNPETSDVVDHGKYRKTP